MPEAFECRDVIDRVYLTQGSVVSYVRGIREELDELPAQNS